jgi:hypothetical protein
MHTLVPALAASLRRLHRSPGRDESWVAHVLRALERERPADYEALRQRLGLARGLAALVRLQDEERATVAVGLFLHELIDREPSEKSRDDTRPWSAYLTRHEDWLVPCLALSQAIESPDWDSSDSKPALVVKVATILDLEATEGHSRPLQILQSLTSQAPNKVAQEVIDLLWSEEGQQLCQRHFSTHRSQYAMNADEIRRDVELLRRSPPAKPADTTEDAEQPEGSNRRTEVRNGSGIHSQPGTGSAPANGFERRRQALRSGPGWTDHTGRGTTDASEQHAEEHSAAREETAMTTPDITPQPSARRDSAQLGEKLGELRAKLDQIRMVAAEGQAILESLAPQIDEVSSWMTDLEGMIDRWKQQHGSREAAA